MTIIFKNIGYCLVLMLSVSCQPKPEPINYGQDGCSYCKMTIVDKRYAAELVTEKGKVFKFDAVECMINYRSEHTETTFAHTLVSTYDSKILTDAAACVYLRSENLPSPMGMYITAISEKSTAEKLKQDQGGQMYSWEELKKNFDQLPAIKPQALN